MEVVACGAALALAIMIAFPRSTWAKKIEEENGSD